MGFGARAGKPARRALVNRAAFGVSALWASIPGASPAHAGSRRGRTLAGEDLLRQFPAPLARRISFVSCPATDVPKAAPSPVALYQHGVPAPSSRGLTRPARGSLSGPPGASNEITACLAGSCHRRSAGLCPPGVPWGSI